MKKSLLLFVSASFVLSLFAQQIKEPIRVTDMLNIKTASAVALNPAGTKAVFSLNTIEPDPENKAEYKYVNQLWMAHTDGLSAPWQLTTKENASQAAWSPDGKQLVFVRVAEGKPQLFLLSIDGGGGEARQLTRFKYGAGTPRWSPDGKQVLFTATIAFKELLKDSLLNPGLRLPAWPLERPGMDTKASLSHTATPDPNGTIDQVRAYLDNNVTDKKARVLNKLNFQDEADVSTEMSFAHLFIVDAVAGARPLALTHGFYRFGNADFTPDGKQIIFSGSMDSLQHPDRVLESSIFAIHTDGSNFRVLLAQKKGRNYSSPQVSHSGQWLAFQYNNPEAVGIPLLGVLPLTGTEKEIQDLPFDRNKTNLTWSADDKFIYFTSPSNGGTILCRAEWKTKKITTLTDTDSGISSFDLVQNKLVFTKTEVANPSELYIADALAKNTKRISGFNTGWLQNKQLSFPEKRSFVNEKGLTIEYWIMKPINIEAGKKYPLLLEIHGGPAAMWGPGESSMWHEYQYFCSKGYGVVYSNPRGSGGYGEVFLRGNINDWGKGPASDVLTALDKTVADGWADPSRLLVTGGSYAGYLVSWIISHDQRFKAACAQRGVYDLATFFGEGNAWRLVPGYFGGYPWDAAVKPVLERESPINYVQDIKTPFIIFHGENDRRTGVIQSEMLYRSLKAMNRPVEYVRHPGAGHEITRSGNNRQRIDQLLRTWEFFERWLH